jgi:hypothetical protein
MNNNNIDGDLEKAPESPIGSEAVQESPPDVKSAGHEGTRTAQFSPAVAPEPAPNGGTLAWLQVLGSFCLWIATL